MRIAHGFLPAALSTFKSLIKASERFPAKIPPETVPLIDNHMHCTFADPKLLCGGTDGGPVLYDVKSQALGPVLHIPFQTIHSPPCGGSSYAGSECGMHREAADAYRTYRRRDTPCVKRTMYLF